MTALDIFNYDGAQVRVVVIDGEPWFIAQDVAVILDYSATSAMTRRLDAEDKGVRDLHTLGGMQQFTVISEAGLYVTIFGSQAPGAQAFKRKVTHEILPAIRKSGSFGAPALSDEEIVHQALAITSRKVKELEAKVEADAPKVLFANAVAASEDSILIAHLATILKQNGFDIGEIRLFKQLREEGFLCASRGSDWNRPTQRAMNMGLFEVIERTVQRSDGPPQIKLTPKVTGKGQAYFVNRYAGEKVA